jgi:NitT/TauT family transport system substrate-binding protein
VAASLFLASPAVRAETNEVRFGLQYGFIYLPIVVAADEGFIEKRAKALGAGDVKVTLHRLSGTPAMNEALLSGNLDIGALGLPGVLIASEKTRGRQNIKLLAGLPLTAFVLYSNRPEAKSFADLTEADRIALPAPNSVQGIYLRMAAEKVYGAGQYERADKMMIGMPHPDAVVALVSGGSITGYFSTPPFSQRLANDPRVHPIATSKEILGGFEMSGSGVATGQGFVDGNPNMTKAVLLGLDDANQLIRENKKRAAEIYMKAEPSQMTQAQVEEILSDGSMGWQTAPGGVKALADFMARTGMLKSGLARWQDAAFPVLYDHGGN